MSQPTCYASVLLASVLICPAFAADPNAQEQKLKAELTKAVKTESDQAVSEYIHSFPNVFQLGDAAKAFTDKFSAGVTANFIHEGLAEFSQQTYAFDVGTLYDVMTGACQLASDKPIIFSPFGLGVLDVAVGKYVYDQATAQYAHRPLHDFFLASTSGW